MHNFFSDETIIFVTYIYIENRNLYLKLQKKNYIVIKGMNVLWNPQTRFEF